MRNNKIIYNFAADNSAKRVLCLIQIMIDIVETSFFVYDML